MPFNGLKIEVDDRGSGCPSQSDEVAFEGTGDLVRGKPGSLLEMARASLALDVGGSGRFGGFDLTMEDKSDSFLVSDDGTLKLLSESRSSYNINKDGLSKATTPPSNLDDMNDSPNGLYKNYRCRASDLWKLTMLGRGASGSVYKAVHKTTGELVALKEIDALDKTSRDQMLNEVRTLCELPELEGLVNFHWAFYTPEDGRISIALEYMNAGSLEDCVEQLPGRRIPEHILSMICGKILTGLKYLHEERHLVHRDIKPANLLINLNGEPKITDFGISSTLTNTQGMMNTYVGTMQYMSPERLHHRPYSYSSDVWSIGLTFLQLALGRYPYSSNAPVPLILEVCDSEIPLPAGESDLSPDFIDFITLCMEKDPDDRPSASALLGSRWIQKHRTGAAELQSFVRSLYPDAEARMERDRLLAIKHSNVQ